jgi:hypothetical protein
MEDTRPKPTKALAKATKARRSWTPGPIPMVPRLPRDEVVAREFLARQNQAEAPFESREAARERLMWENQKANDDHVEKMAQQRRGEEEKEGVEAWRQKDRDQAAKILDNMELTQYSAQEGEFSQNLSMDGSQGINCSQQSTGFELPIGARRNNSPFVDEEQDSEDEEELGVVVVAEANANGDPPVNGPGTCQVLYEEQENSKQYLLAMCIGLTGPTGRKLGDCDEEPYKSVKAVRSVHPSLAQLREEMNRRAMESGLGELRKKTAPKPACLSWLQQHPEMNPKNRAWLMREEEAYFKSLTKSTEEQEELDKAAATATANWNSWEPFVRFYSILCLDEVRSALLCKDDTLPRQEMEARNHDERPLDFYELVTKYYNDDSIVITTAVLPELWYTWAYEHELYFHDMPGGEITPEDAKKRLSDCRAKLIYVSASTY